MPRGGARPGAGRKPGTPNRVTAELQAAVAASGETPLEYLLRIMRDPTADNSRRDQAAKDAAPYVHAKLTAVDATLQANLDGSVTFTWLPPESTDEPSGRIKPRDSLPSMELASVVNGSSY